MWKWDEIGMCEPFFRFLHVGPNVGHKWAVSFCDWISSLGNGLVVNGWCDHHHVDVGKSIYKVLVYFFIWNWWQDWSTRGMSPTELLNRLGVKFHSPRFNPRFAMASQETKQSNPKSKVLLCRDFAQFWRQVDTYRQHVFTEPTHRVMISCPDIVVGYYCWWKKSCTTWDVKIKEVATAAPQEFQISIGIQGDGHGQQLGIGSLLWSPYVTVEVIQASRSSTVGPKYQLRVT